MTPDVYSITTITTQRSTFNGKVFTTNAAIPTATSSGIAMATAAFLL